MTLQLKDNLWELKLDDSLDANVSKHLIGEFNSPLVVVNISSDEVDPRWQQGGSFGQAILLNEGFAYGEVKPATLDNYLLLEFPLLSGESYELYYFPLPRLVTAKVKVWEYLGSTTDLDLARLISALESADLSNLSIDRAELNSSLAKIEGSVKLAIQKLNNQAYAPGDIELIMYDNSEIILF